MESLKCERKAQLTIVSALKQKLLDLEQTETEEIGELDFERSLIMGELDSENEKIKKVLFKELHILRVAIGKLTISYSKTPEYYSVLFTER